MNKRVFHKVSYGMYIVSSVKDGKFNGQVANTVFQITSDPPRIAISINKENLTHEFIESSKRFSVSILSKEAPLKLIGKFGFKSGRDIDKFKDTKYEVVDGLPVITEGVIGYLIAEVEEKMDAGTHTVFLGRVIDADITGDGEPMTYSYYHEIKGGKSPARAPTYVDEKELKAAEEKKKPAIKYVCTICGYVYDPEKGDPDGGIPPGTPFEEIPDDWTCPVCGASKEDFEVVEE